MNCIPSSALTNTQQQSESAHQCLTQQLKHYSTHADIWIFKRDWESNNDQLLKTICQGNCVVSPLKRIYKQCEQEKGR